MSCGSGATSVTHNIGFGVCSTLAAIRAAYRLLKNTKAEAHSCIKDPNMNHKLVDTKTLLTYDNLKYFYSNKMKTKNNSMEFIT